MTAGEKIKAARKRAGMTQQELADKLNVSFVNISQFENNKRNPKLETIRKIAAAIGVPAKELMGDYEFDQPDSPQLKDMLDSESWDRWVDQDRRQIFKSREEFEEWSKDFDPSDPPLLTDFFIAGDPDKQKKPASEEDGLKADVQELIDNYEALNPEGKEVLLNTSRGLVASGQYQKGLTVSAG